MCLMVMLVLSTATAAGQTVVCSDAGAGAYEAFPDVTLTSAGDLLCVFYAGYAHVSVPNDVLPRGSRIALTRSTDSGKTWSATETVVDTPIDDRDPSITELPNGDLLVTFMTYDPERSSGTHQVYTVRSADGGVTWGDPAPVDTPFTQLEAVSSPVRIVSGGRLLMTPYGNFTGDPRPYKQAAVLESLDNGHTWTTLAELRSPGYVLLEPDIVELPGGRLVVVMRDVMTFCESTDGGATWTDPAPLGIRGHCPYLLLTSKNILLCGIRDPVTRTTAVIHSNDFGAGWLGPVVIDDVPGAYPSMVELPDGRVLVVYYTEGENSDVLCSVLEADQTGVRIVR